jgi:hypothetical protein
MTSVFAFHSRNPSEFGARMRSPAEIDRDMAKCVVEGREVEM